MIPTIETIIEELVAGRMSKADAVNYLHQHAELASRDLRDDFAMSALGDVLRIYAAGNACGIGADHLPRNCAGHAYRIADAMLRERGQ